MTKKFSKKEAISFGWNIMQKNFWFFAGILAFIILVQCLHGVLNYFIEKSDSLSITLLGSIIAIGFWILEVTLSLGLIRVSLDLADGLKGKFTTLFSCTSFFIKYLIAQILYNLIVLGGLILLVIPGIIWAIKFQFFAYLIVDKRLGPIQALKKSSQITKGSKWDLFLLGILFFFINLLGVLLLFVGLFFTVPIVIMASVFVYRKLSSQLEI